MESSVSPQENDLVLLLFLRRYNDAMFGDPARREEETGSPVIQDKDADAYNRFSGVGILMRTVKLSAQTVARHSVDGGGPRFDLETRARVEADVHNAFRLFFDSLESSGEPFPVRVAFGKRFPFYEEHDSTTFRRYGIADVAEEVEEDASVKEVYSPYAPITRDIEASQTTDVGLKTTLDGEGGKTLTEVEAPITETVHGKAPAFRDIRSPQTTVIGVGNTESDNPAEEREAPITETIHGKSPISRDIRSPQDTVVGLGNAESGNPAEEREAPITETIHGKSPISRDIRSPQDTVVGIGNAESGNPLEERVAPVSETYGSLSPISKNIRGTQTFTVGTGLTGPTPANITANLDAAADILVTSKSGAMVHFDRPITVTETLSYSLTAGTTITVTAGAAIAVTAGAACSVNVGAACTVAVVGKTTVASGLDVSIVSLAGRIYIGNAVQSMYSVLMALVDQIENLMTFGHPGMHVVDPKSKDALEKFKDAYIKPFLNPAP
jgi:hypothetical protein